VNRHGQIRKLLKALEAQHEVVVRLEATADGERLAVERRLESDLRRRLEELGATLLAEGFDPSLTPAPPPLIMGPKR